MEDRFEMKNSAYLDIASPPHSGCPAERAGCSATTRVDCRSNHFFHSSSQLRKVSFDQRYGLANHLMVLSKRHEQKFPQSWNSPLPGLNKCVVSWGVEYCSVVPTQYQSLHWHKSGYFPHQPIQTRYHPPLPGGIHIYFEMRSTALLPNILRNVEG